MENKLKPSDIAKKLSEVPFFAEGIALISGVIFTFRTWENSNRITSILDEGAYLYKGYLYLIGKYFPYKPYGPWGNHMPFSFLIPGLIQKYIGPGLRTGRYFAIFLAGLAILGLWILVRRLSNRWRAANNCPCGLGANL